MITAASLVIIMVVLYEEGSILRYLIGDAACKGIGAVFQVLKPLSMRSIIKGSESLLMILRISFCGKDYIAICAGA